MGFGSFGNFCLGYSFEVSGFGNLVLLLPSGGVC